MRGKRLLFAVLAGLAGLGWLWEEAPAPLSLSTVVVDLQGKVLHVSLSADDKWRLPVSDAAVEKVAPFLLHKEDRHFWWHPGVYPPSLGRALWETLKGHRQGGSTLTMQLARLWRPGPRTVLRKLQEMFWAAGLELRYSKGELLRYYLMSAPFGGNVEGIEAAAWRYFGKSAERLTPLEVAALLLISQQPTLRTAFLEGQEAFRQRALAWVRRWAAAGLLSPQDLRQAEETPLSPALHPFPRLPLNVLPAPKKNLDTLFLSVALQSALTERLEAHLRYWQSCGITQGALLVVEAPTGRVLAYVPSLSYESCALDLIQRRRAVGSTLKPFLWAEAFDRGLLHSRTPLVDAPRSYEGYVPVNFERPKYRGLVPADEALATSLNAPAVDLLVRVGFSVFAARMQELGLKLSPESGEATIVGAAEASLYELVQAYTAMANGGQWVRLRRGPSDPFESRQTGEGGGPWIVSHILEEGGWSYKTGTSARLRDAWCLAWNRRYVVGVWLGNPDGSPSGCLKGAKVALPLAREVTRYLGLAEPAPRPDPVTQVEVCALTGDSAGPLCQDRVLAWAVRGRLSLQRCVHYRWVWKDRTWSYCEVCLPADTAPRSFQPVRLPWLPWSMLVQGGLTETLLPHFPGCSALKVELLSPLPNQVLWVVRPGQKIPLEAISVPPALLLWGRGQDTLGWQAPGQPLWFVPSVGDTLLRLWVWAGPVRKRLPCRVRFLYQSSSGP